jgi:hypothetical protein
MVNVNETTPKLTRPEQTTQKCRQPAFKMSTTPTMSSTTLSSELFMVHRLQICEKTLTMYII